MTYIKFNNKSSDDLGLKLLRGFDRINAEHDYDDVKVLGRDGVLTIDNNRKEPIPRRFTFTVEDDKDLINKEHEITDWLNFVGFKETYLGWDSDYIYFAKPNRTVNLKEHFLNFSVFDLELLFQPWKLLKSGQDQIKFTTSITLDAMGNQPSKPLITLDGTAPKMTININGRITEFKDVNGGIIIDSLNRQVYWGNVAQWSKLVRKSQDDFPYLDLGMNTIIVTGATRATIKPNWVVGL